jgi:uracil-DNA glycosylase
MDAARQTAHAQDTCAAGDRRLPLLARAGIETVKPHVLVVLGATALKALLEDKNLRLQDALGKTIEHDGRVVVATWHPSYGLRAPDVDTRERVYADIVDALRRAGEIARQAAGRKRS